MVLGSETVPVAQKIISRLFMSEEKGAIEKRGGNSRVKPDIGRSDHDLHC